MLHQIKSIDILVTFRIPHLSSNVENTNHYSARCGKVATGRAREGNGRLFRLG